MAVSQVSSPVTFLTTDIGKRTDIGYNGYVNETLTAGLEARTIFQLSSVGNSGKQWNFIYSVQNLASAPITNARVSIFGFDVDGVTIANNLVALQSATSTGVFGSASRNGNVPQIGPTLDVCFRAGGGGSNCASGGGGGNSVAESFVGGTFRLTFATSVQKVMLDNFFVRYQSVNSNVLNGASGVGVNAFWAPAVPEPAVWAQLITGFGLLGLSLRRHRAAAMAIR
ncbi:hypothetical protein IP88_07105 [alpha proteobacterium AAP81b]|nr:hypothetical protein IP88_07105 [alpha proteobacterium AAP81b]